MSLILRLLLALLDVAKSMLPAWLVARAKTAEAEGRNQTARAIIAEAELKGERDAAKVHATADRLDRRDLLDHHLQRPEPPAK